jgi:hypothetical protein
MKVDVNLFGIIYLTILYYLPVHDINWSNIVVDMVLHFQLSTHGDLQTDVKTHLEC